MLTAPASRRGTRFWAARTAPGAHRASTKAVTVANFTMSQYCLWRRVLAATNPMSAADPAKIRKSRQRIRERPIAPNGSRAPKVAMFHAMFHFRPPAIPPGLTRISRVIAASPS